MSEPGVHDLHSFAEPEKVRVRHVDLDLKILFGEKRLKGTATLTLLRNAPGPLTLDTRDLLIEEVEAAPMSGDFEKVAWKLGERDAILGAPLLIDVPQNRARVRIAYRTSPGASGLQWLEPEQTSGKKHPYLFSQNESIHARSWIPLQDSPGVRITYTARIETSPELLVLMSADHKGRLGNAHRFTMELPIPAYLIAIAAGDIHFQATGVRTGVYAEPDVLARAAHEFEDLEKLVEAVERLYGPYRWGRYDLLMMPPSFPFGGMENPRLTFATPTVIAGDKSLVGLVSHELAHSWSGNLVTNAAWSDFWLNEGFTTYIENRIQEAVFGREQAAMEQVLARRDLDHELSTFPPRDQILHIDLKGRDPDEGATQVPYIKGALFLRQLEEKFGRAVFDDYLRRYFDHFSFQSITTSTALAFMNRELFAGHPGAAREIPVDQWVYQPGLPPSAPKAESPMLAEVSRQAREWANGTILPAAIDTRNWATQQWLEFLQSLPSPLSENHLTELDHAFHFTNTGNDEVLDQWLKIAVASNHTSVYGRLREFLLHVGRMRMIKPLYQELNKTPDGRRFALEVYAKARPGYHPIAQTAVDKILGTK